MSSRFAKLVQAQEERKATNKDRQLSTTSDSQPAAGVLSHHSAVDDSQLANILTSPLPDTVDNRQSTISDRQIPPASEIATEGPQPAIRQAISRKVDSYKRGKATSRKGDRHRSDKVPFNNRLTDATVNRIKHFCVDHDLEQQAFAELAAIHFMDTVDSQQIGRVDSTVASDERDLMIMYKTNPTIINLYLHYNPENRWKPADDYEGVRYNGKDIRLVEVGIIQTQFNARFKKVNSFKYYTTEIDMAFETPLADETIEIMLKHGRRRWSESQAR